MKYIPIILLLALTLTFPSWATISQSEGRPFFTVNGISVNPIGQGYGSDGTGTPYFADVTGYMRMEVPGGAITGSGVDDEGEWIELGNLGAGGFTTVVVVEPLEGTGTFIDPLVWAGDSTDIALISSSTTEVLFNDAGYATGDADFTWDKILNVMTVSSGGASISIDGINDTITASGGTLGFGDDNITTIGTATHGGTTYPASVPGSDYSFLMGYVDGSSEWSAVLPIGMIPTLDAVYDSGNTIDYTGASTSADAVILSVVTGEDPGNFLKMYFDTKSCFEFQTDNDFIIYNSNGNQAHLLNGNGTTIFNIQENSLNNLQWNGLDSYIFADASADCVSIVPTEYIGDADTAGTIYLADGSANYTRWSQNAMSADVKLSWPTAVPGSNTYFAGGIPDIDGVYQTVWTEPAGTNYIFKTFDCASGTDPVADSTTDTMILAAGAGITVTGDSTTDTATIACTIIQATDTDTDHEMFCFANVLLGTTITASATAILTALPVPYTSTATFTAVSVMTWTPDGANVDTLTIILYVDGVAKDTWTTLAGAAGFYGAAVSETLTQCSSTTSHYVQLYGQVTTQVGTLDVIKINTGTMDVTIK